jgi:hypothetical protein
LSRGRLIQRFTTSVRNAQRFGLNLRRVAAKKRLTTRHRLRDFKNNTPKRSTRWRLKRKNFLVRAERLFKPPRLDIIKVKQQDTQCKAASKVTKPPQCHPIKIGVKVQAIKQLWQKEVKLQTLYEKHQHRR